MVCGIKMKENKTETVRLRVDPVFKQQLQEAVSQGYGKTMSAVIRKAVTQLLSGGPAK